jgi:hypothetical protein
MTHRLRVPALFAGTLFAAAIWSPAAAGTPLTFDLQIASPCLRGTAPAGQHIELVHKGPNGSVLEFASAKAGGLGRFQTCFNRWIQGGDIIVGRVAGSQRRFVVPSLTVDVDRAGNIVSGDGPAGAALHIDVRMGPNGFLPHGHAEADATPDQHGHYAVDFSAQLDIGAGMVASLEATLNGDKVRAYGYALWIVTQRGQSNLYGFAKALTRIEVRGPDGHLRAEADTGPLSGQYLVLLVDSLGQPVYLRPGDRIVAPGIADADLLIPAGRLNGDPATDTAYGRCMPNAPFDLWAGGQFTGTTNPSGAFRMDLTGKAHLPLGKLESLFCHYPTGDVYQINSQVH